MDNKLTIDQILKINEDQQKVLLRFLSRSSLNLKIQIFELHRKYLYSFKTNNIHQYIKSEILSYCALIKSLQKIVVDTNQLNNKNFTELELSDIKKLSSQKAKLFLNKKHRKQSKRDKLLAYWSIIKTLKENEGFSFRKIARYLQKNHKLQVVHSTIFNMWIELENNKTGEKDAI